MRITDIITESQDYNARWEEVKKIASSGLNYVQVQKALAKFWRTDVVSAWSLAEKLSKRNGYPDGLMGAIVGLSDNKWEKDHDASVKNMSTAGVSSDTVAILRKIARTSDEDRREDLVWDALDGKFGREVEAVVVNIYNKIAKDLDSNPGLSDVRDAVTQRIVKAYGKGSKNAGFTSDEYGVNYRSEYLNRHDD
jgi:hypothetical protein